MDETRVHHYQPEKNNQSNGSTRHRRLQRRHEFPFSPYFPESFALAYSKTCQKNNIYARISKLGRNTYKKLYFQKIVGLTMHQRFLYTMLKTFHGALVKTLDKITSQLTNHVIPKWFVRTSKWSINSKGLVWS